MAISRSRRRQRNLQPVIVMDHLQQVLQYFRRYLFITVFIENAIVVTAYWYASNYTGLNPFIILAAALLVALLFSLLLSRQAGGRLIQPLRAL